MVKDCNRASLSLRWRHIGVANANGWGIEPGAVGSQTAILSNWNHSSTGGLLTAGEPPVGNGTLYEENDLLKARGQYWVDDEPYSAGAYRRTKRLGELAEFSIFGYATKWYEDEDGVMWAMAGGFDAVEFSPVYRGASDHAGYPTGLDVIALASRLAAGDGDGNGDGEAACIGCGAATVERYAGRQAVCRGCFRKAAVLYRQAYGCNDDAYFEPSGQEHGESEEPQPTVTESELLNLRYRYARLTDMV